MFAGCLITVTLFNVDPSSTFYMHAASQNYCQSNTKVKVSCSVIYSAIWS